MTDVQTLGRAAFRDYETDGVPSSGARRPRKADIRALFDALESQKATVVDALADLKALTTRPNAVLVRAGKAAGVWEWEIGSSTTADDALVVQCTTGTAGRYKRLYDGAIYLTWFTGYPDGTTDNTDDIADAVAAAISAGAVLHIPAAPSAYINKDIIDITPAVGGIHAESGATFSGYNGTGAAGGCWKFNAGNYGGKQFTLPATVNYGAGPAVHGYGCFNALVHLPYAGNCDDGLLLEAANSGGSPVATINNEWFIGYCATGTRGIHLKSSGADVGQHLQGNTIRGNFFNGCSKGVYLEATDALIVGCNDIEIHVGTIDGSSVVGAVGFECSTPTAPMNGPFLLNCGQFMGLNPGGDIVIPNGANGITIVCGWSAPPDYDTIQCNGRGNTIRTTFPQGNGTVLAPLACTTAPNTRASFNGGNPVGGNDILLKFTVPNNTPAGTVIDLYAYSPFTTGDHTKLRVAPRFMGKGTIILAEDTSAVNANEIHIRFMALDTYTGGDTDEELTLEVNG
jgi:hypothetical protein